MPYHHCLSCTRQAQRRGLCLRCYGQLCYRVAAGETTWGQLQAAGLCPAVGRSPWRNGQRWLGRGAL
jgi:hypothetical protein